jgi:hypothetical protein
MATNYDLKLRGLKRQENTKNSENSRNDSSIIHVLLRVGIIRIQTLSVAKVKRALSDISLLILDFYSSFILSCNFSGTTLNTIPWPSNISLFFCLHCLGYCSKRIMKSILKNMDIITTENIQWPI